MSYFQVINSSQTNLNIELSKSIKQTIGHTNKQTSEIKHSDAGRSHHNNIRNQTEETSSPQSRFSSNEFRNDAFIYQPLLEQYKNWED